MCRLVVQKAAENDKQVLEDARRIVGEPLHSDYRPIDPEEFCGYFLFLVLSFLSCLISIHGCRRIFHTTYMGTENSSSDTRDRAKELSQAIGSYHIDLNMDTVVASVQSLFTFFTGKTPHFKVYGGTQAENIALQNIQVFLALPRLLHALNFLPVVG